MLSCSWCCQKLELQFSGLQVVAAALGGSVGSNPSGDFVLTGMCSTGYLYQHILMQLL